jgi:hypothetical protein
MWGLSWAGSTRFRQEPVGLLRADSPWRGNLDRHLTIQLGVARFPDVGEGAAADWFQQLETPELAYRVDGVIHRLLGWKPRQCLLR